MTGVQTCALPIFLLSRRPSRALPYCVRSSAAGGSWSVWGSILGCLPVTGSPCPARLLHSSVILQCGCAAIVEQVAAARMHLPIFPFHAAAAGSGNKDALGAGASFCTLSLDPPSSKSQSPPRPFPMDYGVKCCCP